MVLVLPLPLKTLPLPCVATAYVAKTLPLPCVVTAFVTQSTAFALCCHCLCDSKQCICLVLPLPMWLKHCLCPVLGRPDGGGLPRDLPAEPPRIGMARQGRTLVISFHCLSLGFHCISLCVITAFPCVVAATGGGRVFARASSGSEGHAAGRPLEIEQHCCRQARPGRAPTRSARWCSNRASPPPRTPVTAAFMGFAPHLLHRLSEAHAGCGLSIAVRRGEPICSQAE